MPEPNDPLCVWPWSLLTQSKHRLCLLHKSRAFMDYMDYSSLINLLLSANSIQYSNITAIVLSRVSQWVIGLNFIKMFTPALVGVSWQPPGGSQAVHYKCTGGPFLNTWANSVCFIISKPSTSLTFKSFSFESYSVLEAPTWMKPGARNGPWLLQWRFWWDMLLRWVSEATPGHLKSLSLKCPHGGTFQPPEWSPPLGAVRCLLLWQRLELGVSTLCSQAL